MPPVLVRTGTFIITIIVIALAVAFYTIRYSITIEVEGRVMPHDTLQIVVPYKYLYLFTEPRQVSVTYEGENTDSQPHVYPITSFSRQLLSIGSDNYFIAEVSIASDSGHFQIGQKAVGQIYDGNNLILLILQQFLQFLHVGKRITQFFRQFF